MIAPLAATTGGGGLLSNPLIPLALMFAIFYFLLIAPARRKQKRHEEMLGSLKPGDKIVTNGGMHGTVIGLSDDVIQLRIAEKVKVDLARNAVAGLVEK